MITSNPYSKISWMYDILYTKVGCFVTIEGPIINVMRKSFQGNHKNIYEKCMNNLPIIKNELQKSLKLNSDELIEAFLSIFTLNC